MLLLYDDFIFFKVLQTKFPSGMSPVGIEPTGMILHKMTKPTMFMRSFALQNGHRPRCIEGIIQN